MKSILLAQKHKDKEGKRAIGKMEIPPEAITFRFLNVETDVAAFEEWIPRRIIATRDGILNLFNNFILWHPWFRIICLRGTAVGFMYITSGTISPYLIEVDFLIARMQRAGRIAKAALSKAMGMWASEDPLRFFVDAKARADNAAMGRMLRELGFHSVETQEALRLLREENIATYRCRIPTNSGTPDPSA